MNIVTLTLNPAFDRHCHVAEFETGHEFLAADTEMNVGGKGVNISLALTANGVKNTAVVVVGDRNGAAFCDGLTAAGMDFCAVEVDGRIRENLTIHTDSGEETRISFNGFSINGAVLDRVMERIAPSVNGDTVVTLTGRMPQGVSMVDLQAMIADLQARGAKLVIDSRSFTKNDLLAARPWLIKPNQEEISTYLDRPIVGFADALSGAKELCAAGIGQVLVSLGEQGAMLVTADRVYTATAPSVTVQSTIGAGDASVAGFLSAVKDGCTPAACLARAVAFGSAACETAGTRPPAPAAVARLIQEITTNEVL